MSKRLAQAVLLGLVFMMCTQQSTSNSSLKEDFNAEGKQKIQLQHQYLFLKQWMKNETQREEQLLSRTLAGVALGGMPITSL
ncbi:hypothetical protein HK102_000698 [Quaeritorhiza haematococci]|nr:hypothetical protein HK102_000698 [Quaeritorhiza haematococci]